jgi:hypothetical protein
MQIPRAESVSPFNLEILRELYQKMNFPQSAQIFELFLPTSTQFPSTNPPYPSSMFSTKGDQVISSLCALLGYYSDQWVDEPILTLDLHTVQAQQRMTCWEEKPCCIHGSCYMYNLWCRVPKPHYCPCPSRAKDPVQEYPPII